MKPRHIALLLFPLLAALCSAWGPRIIKAPCPSVANGPSLPAGLDFWYANEAIDAAMANSNTNRWWDSSGSLNHATNTAGGPKILANRLNGKPALAFTAGGILNPLRYTGILNGATGATLIAVVRATNSTLTRKLYCFSQGDSTTDYRLNLARAGSGGWNEKVSSLDSDTPANVSVLEMTWPDDGWKLLTIAQTFSTAKNTVRTNTLVIVNEATAGTANAVSATDCQLISIGGDTTTQWYGEIAEFMFWSRRLSATEITWAETNLMSKFFP